MINYFAKFNPALQTIYKKIKSAPKHTEASEACKDERINYYATKNPVLQEIMDEMEDKQTEA